MEKMLSNKQIHIQTCNNATFYTPESVQTAL